MKQIIFIVFLVMIALCGMIACKSSDVTIDTTSVKHLDLKRFMGRWYEIARYDHRFERGMTHVTADYSMLPDGKIRVVNRGIKDEKPKEVTGTARQPDPINYPGRLEVSFFLWFYSDYYVFLVDKNYQYAIIGSSSDDYLWILSRTPQLSPAVMEVLLQDIRNRGYDLQRLVYVQQ
ncbi:MAG: lipocalin [Mediterranea massiliensis]|nr:lipocalin [Mediterranea massiliensis]